MFDNIGGKIKGLAKVVTWVGIIASVVSGVSMFASDSDLALPGILVIVFGSLGSWIGSFLLYGFGELIEQTTKMNESIALLKSDSKNAV